MKRTHCIGIATAAAVAVVLASTAGAAVLEVTHSPGAGQ